MENNGSEINEGTMSDLMAELDNSASSQEDAPADSPEDNENADAAQEQENKPDSDADEATPEKQDEDQQQYYSKEERAKAKQNATFAQMRVENTSLRNVLGQIAASLGINPEALKSENPDDFLSAVVGRLNESSQSNTPPSQQPQIDQRAMEYNAAIQRLQDENFSLRKDQAEFVAKQGFEEAKRQFNLSNKDLETFADQLAERGINPYRDPKINVVEQFKLLNYDKLVEREAQARAEEILARKQEAAAKSTSPGTATGANMQNANADVKSVEGLNSWLDNEFKNKEIPTF